MAGFILCYYVATFFFLQPFFIGTLGMVTGFIGYYGSRPPVVAMHAKWMRVYIWMNYAMIVCNLWVGVLTFFMVNRHEFDVVQYSMLVALIVGCNMLLHMRALSSGRQFYLELLRAGPLPTQAVVIMPNVV